MTKKKQTVHGDWFRWMYFRHGMRAAHIARELAVSETTVKNWAVGRRTPSDESEAKLSRLCGMTLEQYRAGPRDVRLVLSIITTADLMAELSRRTIAP